jgi:hypothetical protein
VLASRVVKSRLRVDCDTVSTEASRLKRIRKNEDFISESKKISTTNQKLKELEIVYTTSHGLIKKVGGESKGGRGD